ncbi:MULTISPECIES: phage tail protein [Klebsiella]|uniref:phage tail protein n=1 Tax=Klebsiella TaxID=570 RepID=UPI001888B905|nr:MULTISPECIES: phage tail protein [Klebsiella]MBF1894760.1 phage tail protein [Klebsiella oxytoca]MBF1901136.1 phage tail protein [Klebsiella oxytoca]MBF9154337.1 phage tail protein [Klebsiella oxytoca]MBF9212322.1 phage tail protein [Klebsiella oxytoca]MBS2889501.1 phage tail protein [Klebsiella pneumoniae]
MSIKNLEKAINNLNSLSRLIVPTATAKALNRVGQATIRQGSRKVAKEAVVGDGKKRGIPVKLVRQRARLKKANPQRLSAGIKINRGNLPAIKLGAAQVRLSRRKGNQKGRGSYLKIGPYRFRNAFIQQLANGRWQVMRRVSDSRYPIDVVKVPLAKPLTVNFWKISRQLINSDMSKELSYALKNQLRIHLTR